MTRLLYKLARITNTLRHVFRGTILKRIVNIVIGRKIHSRGWFR